MTRTAPIYTIAHGAVANLIASQPDLSVCGEAENAAAALARIPTVDPDIVMQIGEGWGSRRIAEGLRISIKTVQTYATRIREKLGVTTASELMREAIRWNERHRT